MRPITISLSPNADSQDAFFALHLLFKPWSYLKGDSVRNLELWFRQYYTIHSAISFNSGRAALYALLKGFDIGKDDEVILQAFTCVAVPNAILAAGAVPIYVDINRSLTINIEYLQKSITSKTKAIIVQHTFGIPANMKDIMKISKEKNIPVIEDCAHIIGGQINNKELGTYGIASVFSFGRDKAFSSVSGGIAITNNEQLAHKVRVYQRQLTYPTLRWLLAQLFHPIAFSLILPLYNFFSLGKILLVLLQKMHLLTFPILPSEKQGEMSEVFVKKMPNSLAALALFQLKKIKEFNSKREENTAYYISELQKSKYILPFITAFPLLRFPVIAEKRDEIVNVLKQRGIHIGKWYSEVIDPKGVDLKKIHYARGSCPYAEYVSKHILNLPTYPYLEKDQIKKILTVLKKYD